MRVAIPSVVCALALACTGNTLAATECCTAAEAGTNVVIVVSAVMKESSASNGVLVRVTIENVGHAPYSLKVCPAMTLCCVRGLHPIIEYEDAGMGLLDLCREENPTPHETFLPAGAAFSFDIRIPTANLPTKCRAVGSKFSVKFCFKDGTYKADSKPVALELGP